MRTNCLRSELGSMLIGLASPWLNCEPLILPYGPCKSESCLCYRVGWKGMVSMLPYGNYWRLCRRISHQNFNYNSSKKYLPTLRDKMHHFLAGLLASPSKLDTHNKLYTISFWLSVYLADEHDNKAFRLICDVYYVWIWGDIPRGSTVHTCGRKHHSGWQPAARMPLSSTSSHFFGISRLGYLDLWRRGSLQLRHTRWTNFWRIQCGSLHKIEW